MQGEGGKEEKWVNGKKRLIYLLLNWGGVDDGLGVGARVLDHGFAGRHLAVRYVV